MFEVLKESSEIEDRQKSERKHKFPHTHSSFPTKARSVSTITMPGVSRIRSLEFQTAKKRLNYN